MTVPSPNRPTPVAATPPELFEAEPPIVSVYVNTRGALPDAAEQVAVRWRNLRRELADGGAPEESLTAVEELLDGAHSAGETLVAISNAHGVLYSAHLPELPDEEIARVGPLPHLIPLIEARQQMIPHLVVATDRIGAEIIAVVPDGPDERRDVEGDELHVTRSAPGGWSQRRFQQRAENRWESNAREVAEEVVRMTEAHGPRLIVVSGDVRAVAFLREHLPDRVAGLLAEVQGDYSSVDEAIARSQPLLTEVADRETAAVVAAWMEQSGQSGDVRSGAEATFEHLSSGRVDTVLIDPARTADQIAWFGPGSTDVAATAEELTSRGVQAPQPAPLADVVVRAAAATKAIVRTVSADELAPSGLGVLLRY